jgi:hypothetical protein
MFPICSCPPMFDQPAKPSTAERQRAFSLRFRTALCEKYEIYGSCPYQCKCMFAHGPGELRTPEMNEADELISDKAIRSFLRNLAVLNNQQAQSQDDYEYLRDATTTTTPSDSGSEDHEHTSTAPTPKSTGYRHNPYSFVRSKDQVTVV